MSLPLATEECLLAHGASSRWQRALAIIPNNMAHHQSTLNWLPRATWHKQLYSRFVGLTPVELPEGYDERILRTPPPPSPNPSKIRTQTHTKCMVGRHSEINQKRKKGTPTSIHQRYNTRDSRTPTLILRFAPDATHIKRTAPLSLSAPAPRPAPPPTPPSP